jgi:RimJ/RimL family protein N-acetyltransferase
MIKLRPLTDSDVDAHNAGEDEAVVRWLTGGRASGESTRRHFARLSENAARGEGKRGFGVWLDDRLAGYVDFDPDADDLPSAGDVNIAYAVHPWARRRGVATAAVLLVCQHITDEGIAARAIIRADPRNRASIGVATRCGFQLVAEAKPTEPNVTYALDLPGHNPEPSSVLSQPTDDRLR